MSVEIISRAKWGARPWQGTPYSVALSERRSFFVHYHGDPPAHATGKAVPKDVERIHLGNGWSGVGYNFMVDQNGAIYEGRGWGLVGAHCPGHNRTGIGVYVAIGGSQKPSDAALRSVRDLYDEACRRTDRTLAKRGHKDGYPTACPGGSLYAWVKAGMPAKGTPPGKGKPEAKVVDLSRLISAARQDPPKAGTPVSYAGARIVEKALAAEGLLAARYVDGHFGSQTVTAYRRWQQRCGYSGAAADGIPGIASLRSLGRAHGFTVTP
ncbi:N-acetylmuramoyl-L-alanine amidase [Streptomyces sp. NBC_01808]|uniref:N-acetylmuramoyl-L-alanine amidase n=1 Tax=Streptomyces sp. NBC_01808 TaxID=2975947 RepID=UPI002DDB27B1|nr:N-acetylmuramoyl-L-alanine amidase [Streptomyces sp. NBC_01808]WSA39464.1 N-acetylmuramoyl-L-alanine amidase [Streptomyces sp. NBC_01808]